MKMSHSSKAVTLLLLISLQVRAPPAARASGLAVAGVLWQRQLETAVICSVNTLLVALKPK
jgi:hypothetical protein